MQKKEDNVQQQTHLGRQQPLPQQTILFIRRNTRNNSIKAAKQFDEVLTAAEYISEGTSVSAEQQKQVKSLRVQCWLNGATCSLELDDFKEAIKLCSRVLDIESCNIKASLIKALEFDPGNM